MYNMRSLFISSIVFFLSSALYAQGFGEFITTSLKEKDITKILPSVDSLIKMAVDNSYQLKFYEADVAFRQSKTSIEKKSWLKYLTVGGDVGYGVYDNLSNQQLSGDPTSQTLFSSVQNRYTIGIGLKIPFSAIANRNLNIKAAKAEVQKSEALKGLAISDLKKMVYKQYSELVKAYKLMIINSTSVEAYKIQSLRAEKDFKSGVITVADYVRLQNMLSSEIRQLETQKSTLFLAFMTLENTIGQKLKM